ncbi:antibiotic biosynthesis monooxygenase [Mucilaginibacter robiniae]|uniref:Antibiotic biosynthesis monooxygenase n=1 Tax=Mucilaginibacter robiniae TaxID=2728022 RepID=A0A7L5DWR4_9SPHI|nr:putative quinol monooxygenase [Mucilaginibacter robiniae]QJD95191.1 antibiotic biosynthesis monooxygenase [Mucilaginibacter robiniae]
MSIKLVGILHCNLDAEETFEQELKKLVETSLLEEGCLKYELYQYNNERCRYLIIEEWKDEESWQKHQEAVHYRYFVRISPVLLSKPAKIKKLTRLV